MLGFPSIMKIGVIADTHGNIADGVRASEKLKREGARFIIHLGDGVDDAIEIEKAIGIPIQYVAGNCDNHSGAPKEHCFSWRGITVLAVHGDKEDLNSYNSVEAKNKSLELLVNKAITYKASLVLFAHTHKAEDFVLSGIRFVNPGGLDLGASRKTCCLLTLEDSQISVVHFPI